MATIRLPKNLGPPNFLSFKVSSSIHDLRRTTALTVNLLTGDAVTKTWVFTPDALLTKKTGLIARHNFVDPSDTDTLGTFKLEVWMTVPDGQIPVATSDVINIVARL